MIMKWLFRLKQRPTVHTGPLASHCRDLKRSPRNIESGGHHRCLGQQGSYGRNAACGFSRFPYWYRHSEEMKEQNLNEIQGSGRYQIHVSFSTTVRDNYQSGDEPSEGRNDPEGKVLRLS
jgi:hypothetical protein